MIDIPEDDILEEDYSQQVLSCVGPKGWRLMAEQCSTCIFRPGNLMRLAPGRVKDMLDGVRRDDSHVVCHQTLGDRYGAACKGSSDAHEGQAERMARRIGFIEFVSPKED